ncbi:Abi family protein [uncultured Megasphaera sp.]|uniref:Abi family protein n=1 Tax=uncultured Megasphaera sp. TaxID=165188 RepID=UPI0025971870|nr:Abi family protein [uncultured Megasphaera sp.]
MKEYKTFNQQLGILRKRGLIVPKDGRPKRFLEQENYYNVINGYKDLFLQKDASGNLSDPEHYLPNTHFNELKALFLFDRELRILFLKYILIFENSFKTVLSHEFSKKYPKPNSYLDIKNYVEDNPKKVLQQIAILTKTIHDKVDKNGAVKHYIEEHGSVPLWVLVNYLTIGNLAHLYNILVDTDKNTIAKYYADKYKRQYNTTSMPRFSSEYLGAALKIINLVRNKCAHDERLYNSDFGNVRVVNIAEYYGCTKYDNKRIIVAIFYLKVLLDKKYFQKFSAALKKIFAQYQNEFNTVAFSDVLRMMGIDLVELQKLM